MQIIQRFLWETHSQNYAGDCDEHVFTEVSIMKSYDDDDEEDHDYEDY